MSFIDKIISDNPNKYESLLKSKILSKKLNLKINEYNTLQTSYDNIIKEQSLHDKESSGGWEKMNGNLKQISSSGKDWIWGVNKKDNVYACKKPCEDSKWIKVPGKLTQIVGGDDDVWGINSSNNIYKMKQDNSTTWKQVSGSLSNISQGGDWVWGIKKKESCTVPVKYGDNITIAQTNNSDKTSNCGWYGCRVGYMNDGGNGKSYLKFGHGDSTPELFYLRPQKDGKQKNGDVIKYGDPVVITYGGWDGDIGHSCGWYGCRVAYVNDDKIMTFGHGKTKPTIFYIRPKVGSDQKDGDIFNYDNEFVLALSDNNNNTSNCGWYGCRVAYMVDKGSKDSYMKFGHGNSNPSTFFIRPENKTPKECSEIYRCKNPCEGNWTRVPNPEGSVLTFITCSDTYVYGIDTDKLVWNKTIGGSDKWKRFGNPDSQQFTWVNVSNNKVIAVGLDEVVYETNIDGTSEWNRLNNNGTNMNTVSGDSKSDTIYMTGTNGHVYRDTPVIAGGSWKDIPNENYAQDLVGIRGTNNEWKYLGQTDNISDCKLSAVKDIKNEYSSIVYTTSNNTCMGGIKGGQTNPTYVKGTITSLAPNGTSRLGGEEGSKILKRMKKIHTEILDLLDRQDKDIDRLDKTSNSIKIERLEKNKEIETLLGTLQNDRVEINKILNEPDDIAYNEDSKGEQLSKYIIYMLWFVVVIISFVLAGHIYYTDNDNISPITYIFVGIWILILLSYYYRQFKYYGAKGLDTVSDALVDDV